MNGISPAAPWLAAGLLVLSALLMLHRPLGRLLRLLLRSSAALGFLVCLQQFSILPSITLGVNCLNAVILGTLGIPGFGLLLMLQWMLRG